MVTSNPLQEQGVPSFGKQRENKSGSRQAVLIDSENGEAVSSSTTAVKIK